MWRAVAHANGIDDPLRIRSGTTLLLPSPEDAVAPQPYVPTVDGDVPLHPSPHREIAHAR